MTETGWPLIPREELPAPVEAAARRRPQPPRPEPAPDSSRQLPFFGAETTEPSPADVAGLLAGPGHLGRMGGTARVSIPVDAAWRVHVLVAEMVARGLVANWRPLTEDQPPFPVRDHAPPIDESPTSSTPGPDPHLDPYLDYDPAFDDDASPVIGAAKLSATLPHLPEPISPAPSSEERTEISPAPSSEEQIEQKEGDGREAGEEREGDDGGDEQPRVAGPRFEVITAYSKRLNGLAQGWPEAAAQLFLSGPRLRLWVAAAGTPVRGGYALGLDPGRDPAPVEAALVRAGLSGRVSDDGRHYLIRGRRRVHRLAELVGDRPLAAPKEVWPGGAGA